MPYELAALLTALVWALGSLIAADLSRDLGGITFNRLRNTSVFFMLVVFVSITGVWQSVQQSDLLMIVLSGFIGIALGDSALFTALQRLGPRVSHMLYACNAPMAVLLSVLVLGAPISSLALLGVAMVFLGVLLAIAWGKPKRHHHRWEQVQGSLWVGIMFGLLGALGQAVGSIIIKPVLDHGAHPVAVSALRIGVAALALNLHWLRLKIKQAAPQQPIIEPKQLMLAAFNGFLSLAVGMSLLMYAFAHGDVGIASILSATTPVLILPLLWVQTRQCPAWGAWLGAVISVIGVALLLG